MVSGICKQLGSDRQFLLKAPLPQNTIESHQSYDCQVFIPNKKYLNVANYIYQQATKVCSIILLLNLMFQVFQLFRFFYTLRSSFSFSLASSSNFSCNFFFASYLASSAVLIASSYSLLCIRMSMFVYMRFSFNRDQLHIGQLSLITARAEQLQHLEMKRKS